MHVVVFLLGFFNIFLLFIFCFIYVFFFNFNFNFCYCFLYSLFPWGEPSERYGWPLTSGVFLEWTWPYFIPPRVNCVCVKNTRNTCVMCFTGYSWGLVSWQMYWKRSDSCCGATSVNKHLPCVLYLMFPKHKNAKTGCKLIKIKCLSLCCYFFFCWSTSYIKKKKN